MNRTHLEHAVFALLIQLPFGIGGMLLAWHVGLPGLAVAGWLVGAALAAGVFLGREHAQAEYRWIETFGSHRRAYLPWWGGFDLRVWSHIDSWLDWIVPTIAVLIAAAVSAVSIIL